MNVRIPEGDGTHRLGGTGEQPSDLVPEVEVGDDHYEIIKHPKHYNSHPSGVECITIIEHFNLNIGTTVKHLWRAGLKPGMDTLDDLKKAQQYLQFEIDRVQRLQPPVHDEPLTVAGVVVGSPVGITPEGKVSVV